MLTHRAKCLLQQSNPTSRAILDVPSSVDVQNKEHSLGGMEPQPIQIPTWINAFRIWIEPSINFINPSINFMDRLHSTGRCPSTGAAPPGLVPEGRGAFPRGEGVEATRARRVGAGRRACARLDHTGVRKGHE